METFERYPVDFYNVVLLTLGYTVLIAEAS